MSDNDHDMHQRARIRAKSLRRVSTTRLLVRRNVLGRAVTLCARDFDHKVHWLSRVTELVRIEDELVRRGFDFDRTTSPGR